jgi:type VI protein secretion system component VasF
MRRYLLPIGVILALAAIFGVVAFLFFRDRVTADGDDFFKTLAH